MSVDVNERISRNVDENDLYVPNVFKECAKKAFTYTGPTIWNSLPTRLKECTNLDIFKKEARKHFLSC